MATLFGLVSGTLEKRVTGGSDEKIALVQLRHCRIVTGGLPTSTRPTKTPVAQSSTSVAKPTVKLTIDQAWQLFTQQFDGAVVTGMDIEAKHGSEQWEVKGVSKTREYELTLDASSGKVLHSSDEALDADDRNSEYANDAINQDGLEKLTSITKIAENQVGSGTATSWDLDQDDGRTVWEVEINHGTHSTNVKIDAYSGEILDMEQDD